MIFKICRPFQLILIKILKTFKAFKDMEYFAHFRIFNLLEYVILVQELFQNVFWLCQMEIQLQDVFPQGKLILSKYFHLIHFKELTKKKDIIVLLKIIKNKMSQCKEKVDFIILKINQLKLTLRIAIIQILVR